MRIVVCPGIHAPKLTQEFLQGLQGEDWQVNAFSQLEILLFPTQKYPAISAIHILQFLCVDQLVPPSPIIFISFSAGVVGAIGAAWGWQLLGGEVKAFIALDGWGVPLHGNFPIHRLSHDYFTHWTSLIGGGEENFYAEPAVEHLDLWRSPQSVQGWYSDSMGAAQRLSAAQFLLMLLSNYLAPDV